MMSPDFLLADDPYPGLHRLKARFQGHAYDLHRHETYALGLTVSGVQAFRYRGADRASTAGKTIVLHPDELHDGHAGKPGGFTYLMLYIDPLLLCSALDDRPLNPFVPDVVADDPDLAALLAEAFEGFPNALEPLAAAALLVRIADALWRRSDHRICRPLRSREVSAVKIARAFLDAAVEFPVSSEDLERETGVDRYALARSFRAQTGTSPHRYLVGRRLLRVRSTIAAGMPLAEAAVAAGFADQSHMTRHFKARFGITPGTYQQLVQRLGPACRTRPATEARGLSPSRSRLALGD